MYKTITASSQFKIYAAVALAALLMTVLAVTLTAGQAQATTTDTTTIAPSGGDNPIPQQQGTATPTPPRHATPEACPGETGNSNTLARVVDSGHYALFDAYWNPDEGELTNNPCPPSVTHVPAQGFTPARDDRSPSGIDITADPPTIIHIPNGAKVNLREANTPYTQAKYPELWDADDAENPNGDGDRLVWALPACPPDGPSESSLCLSFSAALLNPADWTNAAGSGSGSIEYHIDHVHQIDIDEQDPRYVLAYDVPAVGATGPFDALWDTSDANVNVMRVAPGEYERPIWFFTSPGTFEFQVHIKGHPNQTRTDGLAPVSSERSVTGDVREYIFHVGAESDVGVAMTVTPESPSPGGEVTVTITASNAGPDTAPSAKVDVALPEGLTYSSHAPAADAFAESDGAGVRTWDAGSLESGASKTLTVTAAVDAETRGRTLDIGATISATETIEAAGEQHEVSVADPDPSNTAAASVTVASSSNVNPIFGITRGVNENAPGGAAVGNPIKVVDADSADALQFTLEGADAEYFTVSNVGGSAQIAVKPNLYLNYEETPNMFSFMLHVSDLKDGNGNDDTETDDSIAVTVRLLDVEETGRLVMAYYSDPYPPVAGTYMELCVTPEDYPGSANLPFNYLWQARDPGGEVDWTHSTGSSNCLDVFRAEAGTREFRAIGFTPPNGNTRNAVETVWNSITWNPSGQ